MRDTIRFIKAGQVVELTNVGPTETVLDYLRLRRQETGTKEGCGEGDCGQKNLGTSVVAGCHPPPIL